MELGLIVIGIIVYFEVHDVYLLGRLGDQLATFIVSDDDPYLIARNLGQRIGLGHGDTLYAAEIPYGVGTVDYLHRICRPVVRFGT